MREEISEAATRSRCKGLTPRLCLSVDLNTVLALHPLLNTSEVSGQLKNWSTTIFPMNKKALKVVGQILGPKTSSVESGEGAGQWEAIMEKRSAGFTIRPYLVCLIVLGGGGGLYTPMAVTNP